MTVKEGGMKTFFELAKPPTVSVGNITVEEGPISGTFGPESFVQFTTLYFDNDTRTDEIINVEVYEKRRRDDILRRRVHPRLGN
jgi:hypothetical protein